MIAYYPVAFGLAVHAFLWGCGLALLAMPRPWTRYWPVLAAPAGLALQSLAVWAGAYAGLRGTNSYASWAELIPAALLFAGLRRRPFAAARADLARLAPLGWLTALCLVAVVTPLALGADFLTTSSLGSCDAADYAAGARTFMEFDRADRSGFMGLSEVVSVMSVDNFFDFWLRLNHFTPSALIALNGSILHLEPYQFTGVFTAGILALSLPTVFWLARAGLRHGPRASAGIALLYCLSPITWYAVFHVAIGQLLAAQAVALLTWAGIAIWNGRASWRIGRRFFATLAIGYALVLGSYNFIIVVCLIPAAAYAIGLAVLQHRWPALARWAVAMLLPLGLCSILFASRIAGLAERFQLFQTYDFGWRIPALTPEGWFGMVARPTLDGFPLAVRVIAAGLLLAAVVISLARASDRRLIRPFLVLSLTVPIITGYAYLTFRGRMLGTNASYDAYKLLSVFFPGFLAAACCWFSLLRLPRTTPKLISVGGLVALVSLSTAHATWAFGKAMRNPPLQVSRDLLAVREIEQRPDVASINLLLPDMWSRLWANSFLLRKPQYFATHTYEGRQPTPLRGEWDLVGAMVRVHAGDSVLSESAAFSLESNRAKAVRARIGAGWHAPEQDTVTGRKWQWTSGAATVQVDNPTSTPVKTRWRFRSVGSLTHREFVLTSSGRELFRGRTGPTQHDLHADIVIPPGGMTVEISSDTAAAPTNGDSRVLGFQVFGIDITLKHD